MGLYRWQCATMQDRTIQYCTVQYNTMQYNNTHHTKNMHLSRQLTKRKITRINQEHILHTIKTQKLELKVDDTVLKNQQHTTVLSYTHFTKTYTSLQFTPLLRPCLHHRGIREWRQRTFRELDCESEFRRLVAQKDWHFQLRCKLRFPNGTFRDTVNV
jgi:hypothetical protein